MTQFCSRQLLLVIVVTFWLGVSQRCALLQAAPPYQPQIAPASNEGELALSGFQLPDGMSASLFAAEPLLANPVAFCIDERGRIYVAETFRQQKGVEDNRYHMSWLMDDLKLQTVEERVEMFRKHLGEKANEYGLHHDRIRLLTDTDGDGRANTSTVFADGFNSIETGTGAGVLARGGDVYYTCIPKLWKLRDEDGDGVADQRDALHHGYGVRVAFRGHDMHGLIQGPDGRIYFSIGDRGYNVKTQDGTRLVRPDTGAVFRCWPDGSELEEFAYGLRNPQELAFDDFGNLFTCDNNSDSGDQARWVHIVEGADIGWRMYYQYLPDRGPWNREKLWHPRHEGQPAHIVPPIANLADGPSGLAYYPGVGLPARYDGHFFLCDFRGGPANSGIRSFSVKPKGATFELTDSHQFIWKILGTDLDFDYDGNIYISDWVNGWDGLGKGRLYRFRHTAADKQPVTSEAARLMSEGFDDVPVDELVQLLGHADRRIRQEVQFELVERGETRTLIKVAKYGETRMPRIHAIWALGQLARHEVKLMWSVVALLLDSDEEVRAQSARVLGGANAKLAESVLVRQLSDRSPRVRSLVACALGRIDGKTAVPGLLRMLDKNEDDDPVVRHAAVVALSHIESPQFPLNQLRRFNLKNQSSRIRLGLLLALRRRRDPVIAEFLQDSDPSIVLEAVRAIHDEPIPKAMPALAALASNPLLSDKPEFVDSFVRRVLSANYRLGGAEHAESVAAIAANMELPEHLRLIAIDELLTWNSPAPLDRVLGAWRPIEKRETDFVADILRPRLGLILTGSDSIRAAGASLASKYRIGEVATVLRDITQQVTADPVARVSALSALATLDAPGLDEMIDEALNDRSPKLRVEALRLKVKRKPREAVKTLSTTVTSGQTTLEQQGAIAGLAELENKEADAVLAQLLESLTAGRIASPIQLDVLDAARRRDTDDLQERLTNWETSLKSDDPLAKYRVALEGGSATRGKSIFFGRTAASCRRCHKVAGSGGAVGPDLSGIAREKNREYLLESLVLPNAKIARGFETVIAVMDSGRVYSGILKSDAGDVLKLMLPDGSIITLKKDEIEQTAKGQSPMPGDLIKHVTLADLRDLVEYLAQQKSKLAGDGSEPEQVE